MAEHDLEGELDAFMAGHENELRKFRRDLHAHPETGYHEYRTTRRIASRLAAAGLKPSILPKGTGLIVDIGTGVDIGPGGHTGPGGNIGPDAGSAGSADAAGPRGSAGSRRSTGSARGPVIALRADIDALPINDEKDVPYRSQNRGACHACGHDVHTAVLLGTGLFLARTAAARRLPGTVRLIFQPAEEVPGGAIDVMAAGGIASVDRIFALHCDPRLDVGKIGTRVGPITAACDRLTVKVTGPGGHTARPHLTADLVFALGKIITELPAALSRRVDPRSSLSLVWGRVSAGSAANAIPDDGLVEGTVRCLDTAAWHEAPDLVKALLESVGSAYGIVPEITYRRDVPPTVNDAICTAMFEAAADRVLGPDAVTEAQQSLGGEDFAWYLDSLPGALARLGTRTPGSLDDFDIHQSIFDVDERVIGYGVRLMVATALTALRDGGLLAPGTGLTAAAGRQVADAILC